MEEFTSWCRCDKKVPHDVIYCSNECLVNDFSSITESDPIQSNEYLSTPRVGQPLYLKNLAYLISNQSDNHQDISLQMKFTRKPFKPKRYNSHEYFLANFWRVKLDLEIVRVYENDKYGKQHPLINQSAQVNQGLWQIIGPNDIDASLKANLFKSTVRVSISFILNSIIMTTFQSESKVYEW
ncbi:hypothetical protein BC833DRAFT_563540 [Globomyces pollinis-pini]|nr:hypothetical protein BC833DRAFT_563540 [Globomyces pollinis-pini]